MHPTLRWPGLITAVLLLAGCNYDVPLTAKPNQRVNARLLGEWMVVDKENGKEEHLSVRELDDTTYVVTFDGDIYRVFHSDYAGVPFLSVQDLNADNRKYVYFVWQLSSDNTQLTLKGVSNKVIPETTKDRGALQKLIKANLANPALYGDPLTFTRKKPR
jgi:hypothetical protein